MERFLAHYGIHIFLPLIIALLCFKKQWLKAYFIMLLAFAIDLDHLLADPIFDPNRCSIHAHPLHSYYIMPVYVLLMFPKNTRWLGIGLVIHLLADITDCALM